MAWGQSVDSRWGNRSYSSGCHFGFLARETACLAALTATARLIWASRSCLVSRLKGNAREVVKQKHIEIYKPQFQVLTKLPALYATWHAMDDHSFGREVF
jgi:hypothetical protein